MAVDRSWRWIAWLILGIGTLILAGGLALGWGSLRHVLHGERAEGEVVEIRREGNMYAPVVRFRLPNGESREVKDLANGAPDFALGDRVTILYMAQDPDDFGIGTFDRLWFSALFVTIFASFWLLFGAMAWAAVAGRRPLRGGRARLRHDRRGGSGDRLLRRLECRRPLY